ncbi:MAG: ParB/RepB/Spo0J family partition protein [Erysipelotrichaceae bacterium]|jgi:ParB family chromosome partitioning protein|nr:ParB/RepB/Spo0J family partition protein [Erysipelotrichaceae bacterium]
MAAKRKLGKGLDAIFGENIDSFLDDIEKGAAEAAGNVHSELPISQIRPNPYQPRKEFDENGLKELANSIKENGVFQPILVRKSLSGYELVAGERRLRASKLAGKNEIPAIIVDFDDRQMMEISLLENIQRKDLTPIEEAGAYKQLITKLGYTQDELAKRLGKSRTNVANMLRLLSLPEKIRDMVNTGKLSYGQARTLLSLDDEGKMLALAERTVKDGLSVRELEKLTSRDKSGKKKPADRPKNSDPFTEDMEDRLRKKFSTKVEIRNKAISISYTDTEDLNRILDIMGVIEE